MLIYEFKQRPRVDSWDSETPKLEKASTLEAPHFAKSEHLWDFSQSYYYSNRCPVNIHTCANRISMRLFLDPHTRVRILK